MLLGHMFACRALGWKKTPKQIRGPILLLCLKSALFALGAMETTLARSHDTPAVNYGRGELNQSQMSWDAFWSEHKSWLLALRRRGRVWEHKSSCRPLWRRPRLPGSPWIERFGLTDRLEGKSIGGVNERVGRRLLQSQGLWLARSNLGGRLCEMSTQPLSYGPLLRYTHTHTIGAQQSEREIMHFFSVCYLLVVMCLNLMVVLMNTNKEKKTIIWVLIQASG